MSKTAHKVFLSILVTIVILTLIALIFKGTSYYRTIIEERFYHQDNNLLKPSGVLGHGFGIFGSFLMVTGVVIYMARKRYRIFSRLGILKHWLEFHIFLCTIGPILILFHTAFKFGGLVAISFWSMVAVFISGIIGRFIYIQIPRSIEGQELSLNDIRALKTDIAGVLKNSHNLDEGSYNIIADSIKKKIELYHSNTLIRYMRKYFDDRKTIRLVRITLRKNKMPKKEMRQILTLVDDDIRLNRKIDRLDTMQNLFKYWHVIHSPFALVMLIIMVIHIGVTIAFGYRWIF
jgi:sulfur relay (sulfurtransferase) DsrC/TusE family protein